MKRPTIAKTLADLIPLCEFGHTLDDLHGMVFPERSRESVRSVLQAMLRRGLIVASEGMRGREFRWNSKPLRKPVVAF